MKYHSLIIHFNTQRQSLKCFGVIFLNMGHLGNLEISKYNKTVSVTGLPFMFKIKELAKLIETKKLRYEEMTIEIKVIEKEKIILKKEIQGGKK